MPTSYPAEFRRRAIALVKAGATVTKTANDLGVTTSSLYNWVKRDLIDSGELEGVTTKESRELTKARKHIRELEAEVGGQSSLHLASLAASATATVVGSTSSLVLGYCIALAPLSALKNSPLSRNLEQHL